jgi:NAD(P)-dependent dehydrogenase (short-subunit alcohol dehydrogenase family)
MPDTDPAKPVAGKVVVVSGGASGLGEATVRLLAARGARVAIIDRDAERGKAVADDLGDAARTYVADVADADQVQAAIDAAVSELGPIRAAVICAGVGFAQRTVGRGGPADLDAFSTVIRINLIGTYNVLRLAAAAMASNEPDETGERGVAIMTASVAAFDGQIGQTAYSASKGGVASMTLPAARDLSVLGIRVCTIAPGVFETPMFAGLPPQSRDALAAQVPFPSRLGAPSEYALLACQIIEHPYLNGETIRLDAALRMGPR